MRFFTEEITTFVFAFGRIKYFRWAAIHYEEWLDLKALNPTVYKAFTKGDFAVHHTCCKGGVLPIDQAPEKAYNKPAKDSRGRIGITRKKESIAKWNLIEHKKMKYTKLIDDLSKYNSQNE